MVRKYLATPSVEDKKDFIATMLFPKLEVFPLEFRIPYVGEIKNQGQVGSCVGHSAAYCREMVEYKQSGTYKKFSVGFVYGNREATDMQGEGMMPREMLKALQKYGDVLYEDFPYNEDYPMVKSRIEPIKDELYVKAAPYKISAYAKLNDTDEVKSALMQLGPVTICIPVYDAYERLTKDNRIVPIPSSTDRCLGYHENTIVGWTTIDGVEYWIDLNSWGPEWGDGGYCLLPFDFPMAEAWSITDSIVPQPSPNPETHTFYRVQSKKYITRLAALKLLKKVIKQGYSSAVLNTYEDRYVIQAMSYTESEKEKAEAMLTIINRQIPYGDFEIKHY